jgi:hypothetical protein
MFLDQVITADNSYLKPWNEIKATLSNKSGSFPNGTNF